MLDYLDGEMVGYLVGLAKNVVLQGMAAAYVLMQELRQRLAALGLAAAHPWARQWQLAVP